jgi:hypothetical protein
MDKAITGSVAPLLPHEPLSGFEKETTTHERFALFLNRDEVVAEHFGDKRG